MAGVICAVCGHANPDCATDCAICGTPLAPAPRRPVTETLSVAACPSCGAAVPDPANLVCVECLEPLAPAPAVGGPSLLFPGRGIAVPQPGSVLLGRDNSPFADYFATHDNVSRRHATVGADQDGRLWVRDEYSANGTFVNDKQVPAGQTVSLTAGDRLRLASNVEATIDLGEEP